MSKSEINEDAWSEVGSKFQEFMKAEPVNANLQYTANWEAFRRWVKTKSGEQAKQQGD